MKESRNWFLGRVALPLVCLAGLSCQQDLITPQTAQLILQLEWEGPGNGMASPSLVDSAYVMVFQGPDLVVRRAMEILEGGARGRLELEVPVGQLRIRVEGFRGGLLSSWGETTVMVMLGATQTATVRMTRAGAVLDMVAVPGGTFQMGSPQVGDGVERPVHTVTVNSFSMSRNEVRQQQYVTVTGENPSVFPGADRPVEAVSWFLAAAFCNALSLREGYVPFYDAADLAAQMPTVGMNWDASGYRLPTEAEWEYACRAGSNSEFYWGETMDDRFCWHAGNSGNTTHDGGTREPNGWSFHDMSGNASEWCNDWFDPDYYAVSPSANPRGPTTGTWRVIRGGAYAFPDFACRSASRTGLEPGMPTSFSGIRPVRSGSGVQVWPNIDVSRRTLSFPFTPGESVTGTLTVRNIGNLILNVSTVADDLTWLSVSPASFTLAPGATQELHATAQFGTDLDTSSGTIVILSNDPDEPTAVVSVVATSVGISGLVTDAQTGSALADVRLDLAGPMTRSTTTGQDGRYEFPALLDGAYDLTASRSGYITENKDVVLAGQSAVANFVLSRQLAEGQYRIVMSWGTSPRDLDSHMWVGDQYHIYYPFGSRGSETSEPYAYLDRDDTDGEGPETITIYQLIADCKYAVLKYSSDETPITQSNARVVVYSGTGVIASWDVPQSGTGLWWYVFDLSQNGTITPRNYLTESAP
ncbi:MAG: SUMF1/EgtB/PvdO family nonheme iron enzyme [Candidatus Eisenbacteria bacterium]|nr:SUMF1/EgtB/PvdO family nonheme iron enzyme [Candidatus Eisenbacteria bacterium]